MKIYNPTTFIIGISLFCIAMFLDYELETSRWLVKIMLAMGGGLTATSFFKRNNQSK
jgi:hypothetical protein